ncbi:hypothetical protein H0A36_26060 [Endozoicomonas sp. SM1973]|uniref:Uncharacterized protein n=1 Tax=Spartinivicinus marinus TaxID=2994442 RepID=A0A853INQ5_9GAMM|nr:hypothetical protein [Spartinivicinus marinus]MCX4028228.1 hypothetical protein [Spartinivicinus marinus]NYZ69486.1 hypothetical protein [Spartinivicinus marinus]
MKPYLTLDISSEDTNFTVYINGLYCGYNHTINRSEFKKPINQLLVSGNNSIQLILLPNNNLIDFLKADTYLKVELNQPKSDDKNVVKESTITPMNLFKNENNEFLFSVKFDYNLFNIGPWLTNLSPLTKNEVTQFTHYLLKLIKEKQLDALLQLFYVRSQIYATAYGEEFNSNLSFFTSFLKSNVLAANLISPTVKDHQLYLDFTLDSRICNVYLKPELEIDTLLPLDRSSLTPIISTTGKHFDGVYSLKTAVVKYKGQMMLFV